MIAAIAVLIVVALLGTHHHGRHYERNRSRGASVWVSPQRPVWHPHQP